MTIQEELEIVELAKKDIQAFKRIYDYYFPKIFAYTMNRVATKQVAEDIVSQVFLASIDGVKKFDTSKGFRFGSWLYRVAHNKVVDYYKKNKSKFEYSLEDYDGASEEDLDKHVQLTEKQKEISLVLSQIKSRYSKVISLKFYSELENQEIADTMEMSSSQVAVVLHRALKAFKKKFNENYPESEIYSLI